MFYYKDKLASLENLTGLSPEEQNKIEETKEFYKKIIKESEKYYTITTVPSGFLITTKQK